MNIQPITLEQFLKQYPTETHGIVHIQRGHDLYFENGIPTVSRDYGWQTMISQQSTYKTPQEVIKILEETLIKIKQVYK